MSILVISKLKAPTTTKPRGQRESSRRCSFSSRGQITTSELPYLPTGGTGRGLGGNGSGGGTGGVGGAGLGDTGLLGIGNLHLMDRFTGATCRKLGKRERSRRQNPNPFDMKNCECAETTSARAVILDGWDRKRSSVQLQDSEKKTFAYKPKPSD